jgi:iron complex outermembrane recepter protein
MRPFLSPKRYRLRPLVTALAAVVVVSPVLAEEKTLEEVTVTAEADLASRLPETYAGGQTARGGRVGMLGNKDMLDTPFAATSYTSELIASQNAKTVGEVLQNDPSVRFTTPAGHMVENFWIRGFLVTDSNTALNGLYGIAPLGHIPTEMIERVEVFKGPNALLNGMSPAGAIGGAVNIVTKRAGDEPLTRLGFDYESGGQTGGRVDIGRRLGEDKEFGIRFNGAYADGGVEIDDETKTHKLVSLGLDYRGKRGRVELDVYDSREKTDNGSPFMISFASQVIAPPDSSTNLFKGTYGVEENHGAALRGEFDLNEQVTAYAAVGQRENRYWGYINGTRADSVSSIGSFTKRMAHQSGYADSSTWEAGLRGKFSTSSIRHEWVLAANHLKMESGMLTNNSASFTSSIYDPVDSLLAARPGSAPKTSETELSGVALADTLGFLEGKLAVTVGVRNQNIKDTSFNSSTGAVTASYDKSVTTPAVGLVIKPWAPNLAFYANYIEGLAKGVTAPASGGSITVVNASQVFAPYVSKQREVGVKWDIGDYAHTLALYQIAEPMLVYSGSSTRVYSVDGEKQVRGLEWTVMGQITPSVRLLGGIVLARSEQRGTTNGANDGKDAYGVPALQGNLGLEWDLPWLPGVTLSGRAVRTSEQYLDYANTKQIPGWTRYDAGVRYSTKVGGHTTLISTTVSNLFDKNYWTGPYHAEGYTMLSDPRTIRLAVTVDF